MLASVEINSERSSIEIRGIEIIFARNPDQGEERLAAGVGEGGSIRCRAAVSLTGQPASASTDDDENGGGAGVRLKKAKRETRKK